MSETLSSKSRSIPRFDTATVGEWCSYARDAEAEIERLTAERNECNELYIDEGLKRRTAEAERDRLRIELEHERQDHRANLKEWCAAVNGNVRG